jgi:uncharacterized SAM-binding protein YcdF (DUF218 family)
MATVTTAVRILGTAALIAFFATAFSPLPEIANRWLTRPPRLEPADAIVVLGGGGIGSDGRLSDISMRRALHGIALYRRQLAPLLVFSGPTNSGGHSEARTRAALAQSLGIHREAIVTEESALTTHEESVRIGRLLQPRGIRRVLLVADSQGMRRAAAVFMRAGFDVLPAPADDVSAVGDAPEVRLQVARRVLMELCALGYYRVAGYL